MTDPECARASCPVTLVKFLFCKLR